MNATTFADGLRIGSRSRHALVWIAAGAAAYSILGLSVLYAWEPLYYLWFVPMFAWVVIGVPALRYTAIVIVLLAGGAVALVARRRRSRAAKMGRPLEPFEQLWLRRSRRAFFVMLLLLAGALVASVAWNLTGRVAFARARAEVERQGFSCKRPTPMPRTPDSENAAVAYEKAAEALEGLVLADPRMTIRKLHASLAGGRAPDSDWDTARMLLRLLSIQISAAHKAGAMRVVDWNIDFTASFDRVVTPKYGPLLDLSRLLGMEAMVAGRAGRPRDAASAVDAGLALASAITRIHLVIAAAVGSSAYGISADAARGAFPTGPPLNVLESWQPRLDADAHLAEMRATFRDEIFVMPVTVAESTIAETVQFWPRGLIVGEGTSTPEEVEGPLPLLARAAYAPLIRWEMASRLRASVALARALDGPDFSASALDRAFDTFRRKLGLFSAETTFDAPAMFRKQLTAVAELRLLRAVLEARRFRAIHAAWPPAVQATDPFTARPMRVARAGEALVVYSAGPDGKDDGGAQYDRAHEKGDLAWRLVP